LGWGIAYLGVECRLVHWQANMGTSGLKKMEALNELRSHTMVMEVVGVSHQCVAKWQAPMEPDITIGQYPTQ